MVAKRVEKALLEILVRYRRSFTGKVYGEESDESDPLMEAFGIAPALKRENRQYWGRELGMCWQLLVTELCRRTCKEFAPALRYGADEPCDFCVGKLAIDTKYRVGSGDSGTLKKFKTYGKLLRDNGYVPVLLIVREDNLGAAVQAFRVGTWEIYQGDRTFKYIRKLTGFDLKRWLISLKDRDDLRVLRV